MLHCGPTSLATEFINVIEFNLMLLVTETFNVQTLCGGGTRGGFGWVGPKMPRKLSELPKNRCLTPKLHSVKSSHIT